MSASQQLVFEQPPLLGFRFGVFFFTKTIIPNHLDFRFKRVSGLNTTIKTTSIEEGGQNLYSQQLPDKVDYQNLVLERGMPLESTLSREFNQAMSLFQLNLSNVLVSLLAESGLPVSSWLFLNAYPVDCKYSDLDAENNNVVIETLELAYQRMQVIKL